MNRTIERAVATRSVPAPPACGLPLLSLLIGGVLLLAMAGPARADRETFRETRPVTPGASLDVEHLMGTVLVQGWDRDEVEVRAVMRAGEKIVLRDQTRRFLVAVQPAQRGQGSTDLELRVPTWMNVRVEGHQVDVEISGVAAEVEVDVVGGDVFVDGARGHVDLVSVHGALTLSGCEGVLDLESTNEDIEVRDGAGRVRAESVNGDVRMEGMRVDEVEIETTNGDILFDGRLQSDGNYFFVTHNGDVAVSVSPDADLTVNVETWSGEVDSSLPLQRDGAGEDEGPGRSYQAVWGAGNGRLQIETFQGDVHLYDPKRGRSKRD